MLYEVHPPDSKDIFQSYRRLTDPPGVLWMRRVVALVVWASVVDWVMEAGILSRSWSAAWSLVGPQLSPEIWTSHRLAVGALVAITLAAWRVNAGGCVVLVFYVLAAPLNLLLAALRSVGLLTASASISEYVIDVDGAALQPKVGLSTRRRKVRWWQGLSLRTNLIAFVGLVLLTWGTANRFVLVLLASWAVVTVAWSGLMCFEIAVGPPANRRFSLWGVYLLSSFVVATFLLDIARHESSRGGGSEAERIIWQIVRLVNLWAANFHRRLYLVIRRSRRKVAAATVLIEHLGRTSALTTALVLMSGYLIRLHFGPTSIGRGDALSAAIATVLSPAAVGQHVQLPILLSLPLSALGWALLGVWVSPLGELFQEWRDHKSTRYLGFLPSVRRHWSASKRIALMASLEITVLKRRRPNPEP